MRWAARIRLRLSRRPVPSRHQNRCAMRTRCAVRALKRLISFWKTHALLRAATVGRLPQEHNIPQPEFSPQARGSHRHSELPNREYRAKFSIRHCPRSSHRGALERQEPLRARTLAHVRKWFLPSLTMAPIPQLLSSASKARPCLDATPPANSPGRTCRTEWHEKEMLRAPALERPLLEGACSPLKNGLLRPAKRAASPHGFAR